MKKIVRMVMSVMTAALAATGSGSAREKGSEKLPKVYMFKEISSENLVKIYEALGREAAGKVAVKLSTGEPGNNNYLSPALIGDLVRRVGGTIVECNTAYGGGRSDTESHQKAAEDHGFTAIAEVDIMDADGEVALPVKGGRHLKEDFVGSHYSDYDFTVVLSHFKGHPMGGFGGAIKNISIGIASSAGKAWIHSAGKTRDRSEVWENLPPQDDFLESMAEAAKAVADYCGDRILYISVANNLSVDCDCVAAPEEPKMGESGHSRFARPRSPRPCLRRQGPCFGRSRQGASDRADRLAQRHAYVGLCRAARNGKPAIRTGRAGLRFRSRRKIARHRTAGIADFAGPDGRASPVRGAFGAPETASPPYRRPFRSSPYAGKQAEPCVARPVSD